MKSLLHLFHMNNMSDALENLGEIISLTLYIREHTVNINYLKTLKFSLYKLPRYWCPFRAKSGRSDL